MSHNDEMSEQTTQHAGVEEPLARHGCISYLHIPAIDAQRSAAFYGQVFGWDIRGRDTDHPRFDDPRGQISGAWVTDQAVSREPGLLPYIYVDGIHDVLKQVVEQGGEIVKAPYPEGNLWVATFRDPAGNVIGLFEEKPAEAADVAP